MQSIFALVPPATPVGCASAHRHSPAPLAACCQCFLPRHTNCSDFQESVSQLTHPLDQFQRHARRVARHAQPWIEPIARIGYAAKSTVSCLIGLVAILAAMRALEQQPYGSLLLCAVALGLISCGFYQFLRAKYRRIGP